MDGQSGMTKVLGTFCDFAKTQKNNIIKTCLTLAY